jgi:hypothetical protein
MFIFWIIICIFYPIAKLCHIIWNLDTKFYWKDWSPCDKEWVRGYDGYWKDIPMETPKETLDYLMKW